MSLMAAGVAGVSDRRAGKSFGGAVAIQQFVDSHFDIDGIGLLSVFHSAFLSFSSLHYLYGASIDRADFLA